MSVSLEHVVGFRVRVTNVLDGVTEGKIYSFNSANNTITLQTSRKNQSPYGFKVIRCSFIKNLEVIGDKPTTNSFKRQAIKPSMVHIDRVQRQLRESIGIAKEADLLRGKGIGAEAQLIFDLIHKTVPDTRWAGKDIIILDDIKVSPPYKVENITTLHETHSVALIERIIQKGWSQIDAKGQDSDDGRKGG